MLNITSFITAEGIKTIIVVSAFILSILSFLFTRRSWAESNRPIVTAEIKVHSAGNCSIAYNIWVHNTGSRPATDVQLEADEKHINKILTKECSETIKKEISNIFSPNGKIPILHDGKSVKNGFGYTSSSNDSSLNYGVELPVIITYRGLSGKKFKTKQSLILKDSEYFAGSGWA